ncbi:MAG TPA: hypothetical protein VII59_14720 [Streptosporangiaceae bacterium]
MTDPHTSMSLAAILIMIVVVLVTVAVMLAAVFLAAREPGPGLRPGSGGPAAAPWPEAVGGGGEMPAGARVILSDGQPAAVGGTGEPAADYAGRAG